jgi:hypothetical protein
MVAGYLADPERNIVNQNSTTVPAVIVAIGVALGGLLIGNGFARGRAAERYVSVKGVAEQEVRADLAIWPIRVVGVGNDMATANGKLVTSVASVMKFLARHNVDTNQVQLAAFTVSDADATEYGGPRRANRYLIKQTLLVRSNNPDRVLAASQQVGELAAIGVAISSGTSDYGPGADGPSFVFTGLNSLKPKMIAEATARAREAGEQFAKDSRSTLGDIRHANQGVFEILPRDQAPGLSEEGQIAKIVRVVSTIDYFLR